MSLKTGLSTKWGRAQIVIAAFVVVFSFAYLALYLPYSQGLDGYGRTDLSIFYVSGATVFSELGLELGDLYDAKATKPLLKTLQEPHGPSRFLYTPPSAVLFSPLHLIPFDLAFRGWIAMN